MLGSTSLRVAKWTGDPRLGRLTLTSLFQTSRAQVTTHATDRGPPPQSPRPPRPPQIATATKTLRVVSNTTHSTAVLAAYFASSSGLDAGDCYLLFGPVGAGKSHFSREFIRYAMDDAELEVPSPTFLLHNEYRNEQGGGVDVHHYDLYRIQEVNEAEYVRLDLDRSFESGVSLIEWPERLLETGNVPGERIEIEMELFLEDGVGDEESDEEVDRARQVELRAYGQRWGDIVSTLASHVEARGEQLGLRAS